MAKKFENVCNLVQKRLRRKYFSFGWFCTLFPSFSQWQRTYESWTEWNLVFHNNPSEENWCWKFQIKRFEKMLIHQKRITKNYLKWMIWLIMRCQQIHFLFHNYSKMDHKMFLTWFKKHCEEQIFSLIFEKNGQLRLFFPSLSLW